MLLVVLGHAGVPFLRGGFVGVDVFFVLSGFFITGLLVREYAESDTIDIPTFLGRRALRVLPPLPRPFASPTSPPASSSSSPT